MTTPASILDSLNPQQREAAATIDGPLLVIAGAGSGKTRVITHRIAYLIRECGVMPWQIFAATFTNKAAEEMRERVGRLIPGADVGRLSISTFHSLCVTILRREAGHAGLTDRFSICDDTDQLALIKDCLRNLNVAKSTVRPETARDFIAAAKIRMLGPDEARRELKAEFGETLASVYAMYQSRLEASDAVDFDDLILKVVRMFQTEPDVLEKYRRRWLHILVDEYQDTNRVQFELVRLLAGGHGNICVVGDEDQSIYSWRGAEIENLLSFPELFAGARLVRLEQNYRSTESILQAAGAVITHNTQRLGKDLWSERGAGEPITLITGASERDEAAQVIQTMLHLRKLFGVPWREMAVFYRVNALSRVFEDHLREAGVPYQVIGGVKFYDRAEVKDLLAYLRLCVNPRDGVAMARVINRPARGVGDKSLAALFNASVTNERSLWDEIHAALGDAEHAARVSKKAKGGLAIFVRQVLEWVKFAAEHPPAETLLRILQDTDYEAGLGREGELETISRRENIGELVTALEEFHTANPDSALADFLERVALINAQDEIQDKERVSLMTLHCAKGLEFRAVFMVAMEDPLFPSARAIQELGHCEEERRLFYVGMTRAKDLLFLSRADTRTLYGRPSYNPPSLFLHEVPPELLRPLEDAHQYWAEVLEARERERDVLRDAGVAVDEHPPDKPAKPGARAPLTVPEPAIESGGAAEERFGIGARVRHARLGEGTVAGAGGEGDRRKIVVRFDAGLELEILEQYGGLEPVEDDTEMPF